MDAAATVRDRPAARLRGRIAASDDGTGPPVVLLHGVAFGPETLAASARALVGGGARAIVPHRAGYGGSGDVAPAADLAGQVDDVLAVLDALDLERAVWAGVSGGATIALAAALDHPARVAGAVLHEPAMGPLAPELHARLRGVAATVAGAPTPGAGAIALARALAGPEGWRAVAGPTRGRIRRAGHAVRAEVRLFPDFAPAPAALAGLRGMPLVTSVGERSGRERHRAADALVAATGCDRATTPSGHLVQLEAPSALAGLALEVARRPPPTPTAEEDR